MTKKPKDQQNRESWVNNRLMWASISAGHALGLLEDAMQRLQKLDEMYNDPENREWLTEIEDLYFGLQPIRDRIRTARKGPG